MASKVLLVGSRIRLMSFLGSLLAVHFSPELQTVSRSVNPYRGSAGRGMFHRSQAKLRRVYRRRGVWPKR